MATATKSTKTTKATKKSRKVGRPLKYDRKTVVSILKKFSKQKGGIKKAHEALMEIKQGKERPFKDIAKITLCVIAKQESITFPRGRADLEVVAKPAAKKGSKKPAAKKGSKKSKPQVTPTVETTPEVTPVETPAVAA